jgi:hypothetical protein
MFHDTIFKDTQTHGDGHPPERSKVDAECSFWHRYVSRLFASLRCISGTSLPAVYSMCNYYESDRNSRADAAVASDENHSFRLGGRTLKRVLGPRTKCTVRLQLTCAANRLSKPRHQIRLPRPIALQNPISLDRIVSQLDSFSNNGCGDSQGTSVITGERGIWRSTVISLRYAPHAVGKFGHQVSWL